MLKTYTGAVTALMLFGGAVPIVHADAPSVLYSFNVLSIGGESDESFVGRFPGDDLLPYTEDDYDLPEGSNAGGTWGVAHMDIDSDGVIDEDDPIFVSVRNNDDDSTLYSALSRPEYGVIYESEDWVEYWEARQQGPNGAFDNTDDTDFEINDWNGWTDESNAYVYNNLGANQHGLGFSKYRVDYRGTAQEGDPYLFDEIEGFKKTFGFRNTADDPDTPFNERGDCRRFYRPRGEIQSRGYLIPVEDLAELEEGSLPTLFGWEQVDLATYFRDTIAPLLEHEDLFIFSETGLPIEELLPLTHLYLFQSSIPITIDNGEVICGETSEPLCMDDPDPAACQVAQHAAYWGLPAEGATYRSSHLMGSNADLTELVFGDVHPFVTQTEDDSELNLWLQDHFWRDDPTHFGNYELIPPVAPEDPEPAWEIVQEAAFANFDNTNDQVLVARQPGSVIAPLPKPLGPAERPLLVVADLAVDVEMGASEGEFQLIARSGDSVVAYADIGRDATRVHLGGAFDAESGTASTPATSGDPGAGAEIGDFNFTDGFAEYTRFALIVTNEGASLREIPTGDYETNRFLDIAADGSELATVSAEEGVPVDGVDSVVVSGTGRTVVNTLLVFASPGVGPFLRGDCNQDSEVNIADGIALLNHLFGDAPDPDCRAACSANGSTLVDISSAIYIFNFLFSENGIPIPPPAERAEYSQRDNDAIVGCVDYSP